MLKRLHFLDFEILFHNNCKIHNTHRNHKALSSQLDKCFSLATVSHYFLMEILFSVHHLTTTSHCAASRNTCLTATSQHSLITTLTDKPTSSQPHNIPSSNPSLIYLLHHNLTTFPHHNSQEPEPQTTYSHTEPRYTEPAPT